jgi:hypothetical protein
VLASQLACLDAVEAGVDFHDYHKVAERVLAQGYIDLGLCKARSTSVLESGSYKQFYMHRAGHWLGMDVHDAGLYQVKGASQKLRPGMVLTVEPGTYIRPADNVPEAFWNIGVRIEDDVMVTATGHENSRPPRRRRCGSRSRLRFQVTEQMTEDRKRRPRARRSDYLILTSMHDVAIVGAGPVGGTLALAIAQSGLSIVALDAREAGSTLRGDRSLADFARRPPHLRAPRHLRAALAPAAITPITAIDISQRVRSAPRR